MADEGLAERQVGDELQVTATGVHSLEGQVIDSRYRVIERLAAGGMGAVYRAEHTLMNRIVALKVLHPHLIENEDLLKRFQHEARVACKLDHPNAIEVHDFGVWRGAPYLVMEFAEGQTLKDRIAKEGRLSVGEVKTVFTQICDALRRAHSLGIIHRDLKPDNIMLSTDPDNSRKGAVRVRVLDFGIAKMRNENNAQAVMTQVGTFFGTPKYASPEQIAEKPLDGRSDIYALGVMLYECATGQVPFDAPSAVEILIKHISEEPRPMRSVKPDLPIPPELDRIVLRCLEKDPAERFQDVAELRAELESLSVVERRRGRLLIRTGIGLGAVAALALFLQYGGALLPDFRGSERSGGDSKEVKVAKKNVKDVPVSSQTSASDRSGPGTLHDVSTEGNRESGPRSNIGNSTGTEGKRGTESAGNPFFALALRGVLAGVGRLTEDHPVPGSAPASQESSGDENTARAGLTAELLGGTNSIAESGVPSDTRSPGDVGTLDGIAPGDSATRNGEVIRQTTADSESGREIGAQRNTGALPGVGSTNGTESIIDSRTEVRNVNGESNGTPVNNDALKRDLNELNAGKKEAMQLFAAGRALLRNQRYAEAAVKFEKAIELRSDAIGSYISLGNCYLRLQQYDKARNAFQTAVKLDASYAPAHYNLAAYYAVTGDSGAAMSALRNAITRDSRVRGLAANDPDFAKLRQDPAFRAVIGSR